MYYSLIVSNIDKSCYIRFLLRSLAEILQVSLSPLQYTHCNGSMTYLRLSVATGDGYYRDWLARLSDTRLAGPCKNYLTNA